MGRSEASAWSMPRRSSHANMVRRSMKRRRSGCSHSCGNNPVFRMSRIPRLPRRILVFMVVPILLVLIGTLGFRTIEYESFSWLDALYMTVITLSTIGFGETHPLGDAGRVFTMLLILGGVFSL